MSGDCVFDDVKNRVLNGYFFSSEEMTVEFCIATCGDKGYDYAGLEWNIECYCGNKPERGFDWAWLDKCDAKCAGDEKQVCGGSGALSVYSTEGVHETDINDLHNLRLFVNSIILGRTISTRLHETLEITFFNS